MPEGLSLDGWLRKRGFGGHHSPIQRSMVRALRQLSAQNAEEMTLKEIMDHAGLRYDSYSQRNSAKRILREERNIIVYVLDFFWEDQEYRGWADNGFQDKTKFRRIVDVLRSHGHFPLGAIGATGKYHWLQMSDVEDMWKMRRDAIITESLRRTQEQIILTRRLPAMKAAMTPRSMLADGKVFVLPAGKGQFKCAVCGFVASEESVLDAHNTEYHPE